MSEKEETWRLQIRIDTGWVTVGGSYTVKREALEGLKFLRDKAKEEEREPEDVRLMRFTQEVEEC